MPSRLDFPSALLIPHHSSSGKINPTIRLQNDAFGTLLLLALAKQSRSSRILEHLSNSLPGSSGALEVLLGADLLSYCHTLCIPSQSASCNNSGAVVTYLLRSHWSLVRLPQLLNHPGITSEILLAGDQDNGKTGAKMHNLRDPLHDHISWVTRRAEHPVLTFS